MQLTPRYGTDPLVVLDGPPRSICVPTVRQRRRLADVVAAFTDDEWAHPSRCAGWSNRDVIAHLDTTNTFWSLSIGAGLAGEPSQFLTGFDPAATPAAMIDATRDTPTATVLEQFISSTDTLVELLESIDDEGWTRLAEAPPGHESIAAVTHHALWDAWVHERDILLPLGATPAEEPDEVTACLRYVASLPAALAITTGTAQPSSLRIEATDPTLSIRIEVGTHVAVRTERPDHDDDTAGDDTDDVRLDGDAVALVEALSIRTTLDQQVPDNVAWLVHGLAAAFDVDDAR
jgi:uncharacterized protein (TIGR03083 family)